MHMIVLVLVSLIALVFTFTAGLVAGAGGPLYLVGATLLLGLLIIFALLYYFDYLDRKYEQSETVHE